MFFFFCQKNDNVFDKLVTLSIKDNERDIRTHGLDRHTAYEILGPVQKWPTDFLGALCNNAFQQALMKFLVASWEVMQTPTLFKIFKFMLLVGISYFLLNWKWKSEKSRRDFPEMFTWRSGYLDVISHQIHKCAKYTCHKNSYTNILVIIPCNMHCTKNEVFH